MSRKISWNFLKVTLQVDENFEERKKILKNRFEGADTYNWSYAETVYHYQFYDLESKKAESTGRETLFGRITRSPKKAHGRSLNQNTHKSSDSFVHIEEIADAVEFIYDFDSSVLALHRRAPFYASRTTARAFRYLLGVPYNTQNPEKLDVHVEIMRDESFSESILDSVHDLREVKLVFAKPNPGSGDHILKNLHLGLIGEETLSDEIIFDAKKKSQGSLEKLGFLRRSIRALLGLGYLKSGFLMMGDKKHDLLKAAEKTRETKGYGYDDADQPNPLTIDVDIWLKQLREENPDIYPDDNNE
ncbi:MAG: hypothetical protein ACYSWW_21670 [Planctomycetota bacterium]|jgi:hypothetical protein